MKLIDVDAIEIDEKCTFSGKGIKTFLDFIPASYDVDKVVEKIREYADNVAELGGNFLPQVVIEIVKSACID